jgi:hypothetical protein
MRHSILAFVVALSFGASAANANVLDWAKKQAKKAAKTVKKVTKTVERTVDKFTDAAEKALGNVVQVGEKAISFVKPYVNSAEELWAQVKHLKFPLMKRWSTNKPSIDFRPNHAAFHMTYKDQGKTTTCMAQATSNAFEYMLISHLLQHRAEAAKVGHADPRGLSVSRRHIYWLSRNGLRVCSNSTRMTGSWAAQALSWLHTDGTFDEALWPFEVWNPHDPKFRSCIEAATNGTPPRATAGRHHYFVSKWSYLPGIPIEGYSSIRRVSDIRGILAAGYPVIITVFTFGGHQWKIDANNPVVKMPRTVTTKPDNAHYVALMGYDNQRDAFLFVNSWGKKWGMGGFGYLPYDYVRRYAIEGAVIRQVGVR